MSSNNYLDSIRAPLEAIPASIGCAADYEVLATEFLSPATLAYIHGGSGEEVTLRSNRSAFDEVALQSRVLQPFKGASTATSILDQTLAHPFLLAPVAHQQLVHELGECATIAGAEAMDTLFVASTLSHRRMEDIAATASTPKWFQLYFQPDRQTTLDLVKRAEKAGYQALVITVDVPVNGLRYRAQKAGFAMPQSLHEANLASYPPQQPRALSPGQSVVFDGFMADAPDWDDIAWLQDNTHLPVLLKGVMHPSDAAFARERGIAGVVISNHGGRSLDGLPATIRQLPAIRAEVGGDYPLLMDSGIRSGGDIFKALALGADAVLIGRLQLYALAVAGPLGVAHMLRCLRTELEVTMALAGCPTISSIGPESVLS